MVISGSLHPRPSHVTQELKLTLTSTKTRGGTSSPLPLFQLNPGYHNRKSGPFLTLLAMIIPRKRARPLGEVSRQLKLPGGCAIRGAAGTVSAVPSP